MSLNRITLQGRLTKDPEMRETVSGVKCVNFTLAVDRDYKNPDGQRDTDFINCTARREKADFIRDFFKKGQEAIVDGRLQIAKWTDRNGYQVQAPDVQVNSIYFCGPKQSQSENRPSNNLQTDLKEIDSDDDLPF